MCGIGVIYHPSENYVESHSSALSWNLRVRGPDGNGIKILKTKANIFLGLVHRRLAIIDLSHNSDQPMEDEYGNLIVFNGEIYNYKELREELESHGEIFRTNSDTEVILRAFRYYLFTDLLKKLRGMFAFAIFCMKTHELYVARDPMGIKPLYFKKNGYFSCASESSALVKSSIVERQISEDGLDSFLAFGSVIAPGNIWKNIETLLPGHYLTVDSQGSVGKQISYWDWNEFRSDHDLTTNLKRSIIRHTVADVPISLFLSGGYDSAALAALMYEYANKELNTFTMIFSDFPELSEGSSAMKIARRFNANHQEFSITSHDIKKQIKSFAAAMDQPSDDGLNIKVISNIVASYGYKVALHGVGGDELFGGYPSFKDLPRVKWLRLLPIWLRKKIAMLIMDDSISSSKLKELLLSNADLLSGYYIRRRLFSYQERYELLSNAPPLGVTGVHQSLREHLHNRLSYNNDIFTSISCLELEVYAANKLLVDGDVMSMSESLEVRFPFLDIDLVGSVLGLASSEKKPNKIHVKPALAKSVLNFPSDLILKKKRGFTLPLDKWLRSDLRDDCLAVLEDLPLQLGLDAKIINKIWRRFEASEGTHAWLRVWQLYMLGNWYNSKFTINYKSDYEIRND